MLLTLNRNRLHQLLENPFPAVSPFELRRQGTVFFIGGNLPVYETLETMYESYCLESTDLFHVTFADRTDLERNLEMVRQIKKNFTVRLMGRINYDIPSGPLEMAYLAGLDLLDIPLAAPHNGTDGHAAWSLYFRSAVEIFPRWSIVSSLGSSPMTAVEMQETIDNLLNLGTIPLPVMPISNFEVATEAAIAALEYATTAWHRHKITVRPLLPLIRLVTPLESSEEPGFIRTAINRIQDRHLLATSDIRRHLRTSGAESSFESSGL